MSTTPARPGSPRVEDIERSLDGFFSGLMRAWKWLLLLFIIGLIVSTIILPLFGLSGMFQGIMLVGSLLFQLLFAILFMVVQFVALFWFLARARDLLGDAR